MMAVTTLALSRIARSINGTKISIPFTLKDYPETSEDFRIFNDFACLPFDVTFPDSRDTLDQFPAILQTTP